MNPLNVLLQSIRYQSMLIYSRESLECRTSNRDRIKLSTPACSSVQPYQPLGKSNVT
jgi:hypothetical protein